jgi:hypothetical protein
MARLLRTVVPVSALLIVVFLEVWYYPDVSTWLYITLSSRAGWDGSALAFFQRFYITPSAIVFCGASLVVVVRAASRRRPWVTWIVVATANLLLMAGSIMWYARSPRA